MHTDFCFGRDLVAECEAHGRDAAPLRAQRAALVLMTAQMRRLGDGPLRPVEAYVFAANVCRVVRHLCGAADPNAPTPAAAGGDEHGAVHVREADYWWLPLPHDAGRTNSLLVYSIYAAVEAACTYLSASAAKSLYTSPLKESLMVQRLIGLVGFVQRDVLRRHLVDLVDEWPDMPDGPGQRISDILCVLRTRFYHLTGVLDTNPRGSRGRYLSRALRLLFDSRIGAHLPLGGRHGDRGSLSLCCRDNVSSDASCLTPEELDAMAEGADDLHEQGSVDFAHWPWALFSAYVGFVVRRHAGLPSLVAGAIVASRLAVRTGFPQDPVAYERMEEAVRADTVREYVTPTDGLQKVLDAFEFMPDCHRDVCLRELYGISVLTAAPQSPDDPVVDTPPGRLWFSRSPVPAPAPAPTPTPR